MKFGFDNDTWYIEYTSTTRKVGNIKEESSLRALDIANNYSDIVLSFSSGLDSQCMLKSFIDHGIPIETVFMYLPNYNDNEYHQILQCDKHYGIKTRIIDFDPYVYEDEINQWSLDLDISNKNSLLHRKFLSLLPDSCTFIQNIGPPSIYINPVTRKKFIFTGHNSLEISRRRAFDSLNRIGKSPFWDYTPEFLLSTLQDDIFHAGLSAFQYIDSVTKNVDSISVDRWDYFIKPFMYGKYWADSLLYFPKYAGFEKINFIKEDIDTKLRYNSVVVPFDEFLKFLNNTGTSKRYYSNHNPEYPLPILR